MLSGGAPTPAGTSMLTMGKNCAHMKCEVKHNGGYGNGKIIMGGEWENHNVWGI